MQKRIALFSIYILTVSLSNVLCQTIFSDNGKFGIMDDGNNKVVVPPIYDKITECFGFDSFGLEKDPHGFILQKNNKHLLCLKEYWESKNYRDEYSNGKIDSVKWCVFEKEFDSLFPIKAVVERKRRGIERVEVFKGDTCLDILRVSYVLGYRIDDNFGLIKYEQNSRGMAQKTEKIVTSKTTHYVESSKRIFSIENPHIFGGLYDTILRATNDDQRIITLKNSKYGIFNLRENYEVQPQFDSIPIMFEKSEKQVFFCVKKNNFWGLIYLKNDSVPFVSIPFKYKTINHIRNGIRELVLYNGDEYYSSCFYNTNVNENLQLELIFQNRRNGYEIKQVDGENFKLNKDYIPQQEKYLSFTPTSNGKPIVQQKEFEYLISSNVRSSSDQTYFFILKMDRSKDTKNGYYHIADRGQIEKNEMLSSTGSFNNSEYIYRKPRGIVIYSFLNDRFIPYSEFDEEDNKASYEVISKSVKHITDYPETTETLYETNLILKSVKLENEKYKHTFFTFKGTKVHELTSKYQIDNWKFMEKDQDIVNRYVPDEDLAMEFFTEIKGKKNKKKKIVCYYNIKTRQFYR